jgi:acetyl/propionyl-CoA carboxylase alpha subunit
MKYRWERKLYAVTQLGYFTQMSSADWGRQHAEMSGEVMKVLWEDGEPVGYGDPLIAIRPSFPGIKKLT